MIDLSFLRQKNRFDQFGQQPTDQLSAPPLMPDSGENPFGGLFQPPPLSQSPQVPPSESVGVPSNSPVADTPSNNGVADLIKMMQGAYKPKTDASDRFNQLISQFPQEQKPSLARTIGAIGINLGNPKGGVEAGQKFMDEPYNKDLAAWKAKSQPAYEAANLEREDNSINRQSAANVISAKVAADKLAESERKYQAEIASRNQIAADRNTVQQRKADIMESKQNGYTYTVVNGHLMGHAPDGSAFDAGSPVDFNKIELANITSKNRLDVANIGADSREKVANIQGTTSRVVNEQKGWDVVNIQDPTNPAKTMAVRVNRETGATEPIKLGDNQVGAVSKQSSGAAGKGVQPANIEAIQNQARETLGALNEMLDDKGKLKPEVETAIGKSRMMGLQYIPGSQTRAADASIKRLKNLLTIELLGELKSQSRTGATGFGQLSGRELDVLEKSASKLDPTLDEATFTTELNRIKEKLNKIIQPSDGFDPTVTTAKPTASDLIKKYGGK